MSVLCDRPVEELVTLLAPAAPVPRPRCKTMDAKWKSRIAENQWWATAYRGSMDDACPAAMDTPKLRETFAKVRNMLLMLRDQHLLNLGGEEACLPLVEEDLVELLDYGCVWGANDRMIRGEPCGCHGNSAGLWAESPENRVIGTGYALSEDGMWRQHSWCFEVDADERVRVIETTTPRLLYFGVPYTLERSLGLCEEHWIDPPRVTRPRPR